MIESQEIPNTRPKSVFWAGMLFWFLSLSILAMHIYFATIGIVVVHAFLVSALLLIAALLWRFRPRSRITFCLGVVSLVVSVLWGGLTVRTQYLLHLRFPIILPQAVFTAALVWLTYRYAFGSPSRRYFRLP